MAMVVLLLGIAAGAYALHRLLKWMQKHGWIYYTNKEPRAHISGSLIAFQEFIEPKTKHVIEIKNDKRGFLVENTPDAGAPPLGDWRWQPIRAKSNDSSSSDDERREQGTRT